MASRPPWRRHLAAAARAVQSGDQAEAYRLRLMAKTEKLAERIVRDCESDPPLSLEQRTQIARELLAGSGQ